MPKKPCRGETTAAIHHIEDQGMLDLKSAARERYSVQYLIESLSLYATDNEYLPGVFHQRSMISSPVRRSTMDTLTSQREASRPPTCCSHACVCRRRSRKSTIVRASATRWSDSA